MAVAPAGPPSSALIADADPRHEQAVQSGKLTQPRRQLRRGARLQLPAVLRRKAAARQHRALTKYPSEVAPCECVPFAL